MGLGVDIINCFTLYAKLLRLAQNFCASEKLLKSWAQSVKVGRKCTKLFMKLTLGLSFKTRAQKKRKNKSAKLLLFFYWLAT